MRLAALLLGKFDRAAELGVTLTIDPLSKLPETLAPGVLDALELAAGNLIENACEAASGLPDARVQVLIAADPEGLILEVRDTGNGVPPALLTSLTHRESAARAVGAAWGWPWCRNGWPHWAAR
ncbi:ATP-binding protein [Deinococcus malanensis]|uniref:ATP-binding protein n=1 Tax=Deinococcus malanensis TaxID=1706855 RepID=UPI00362AC174